MMGLVGLTLAIVGLYGRVSYSVSLPDAGDRRTAWQIGASQTSVLRFVLRQGLTIAAAGSRWGPSSRQGLF